MRTWMVTLVNETRLENEDPDNNGERSEHPLPPHGNAPPQRRDTGAKIAVHIWDKLSAVDKLARHLGRFSVAPKMYKKLSSRRMR